MGSCLFKDREPQKPHPIPRHGHSPYMGVPPPPRVCSMAAFESLLILTANTFTGYIFLVSSKQGKTHFVFAN